MDEICRRKQESEEKKAEREKLDASRKEVMPLGVNIPIHSLISFHRKYVKWKMKPKKGGFLLNWKD